MPSKPDFEARRRQINREHAKNRSTVGLKPAELAWFDFLHDIKVNSLEHDQALWNLAERVERLESAKRRLAKRIDKLETAAGIGRPDANQ